MIRQDGHDRRQEVDEIMNPRPVINSRTCMSSHGNQGFLEGTSYDPSIGAYVCPCGRQYFSDLQAPEEMKQTPSFQPGQGIEVKPPKVVKYSHDQQ